MIVRRKLKALCVAYGIITFFMSETIACEGVREISVNGISYNIDQSFQGVGKNLILKGDNGFLLESFSSYIVISDSHKYGVVCPLNDGNWPENPFKVVNFSTGRTYLINMTYIPADDIYCKINKDETKVIIEDTFFKKGFTYSIEGELIGEYPVLESTRHGEVSNIIGSCM